MIKYNDYELLYLVNECDEEAERILYTKYTNLIKARVNRFRIQDRYRDDFIQEGLYMLYVAIKTYDEYRGMSFNKYFDLILQRKFMKILAKEKNYFYKVTLTGDVAMLKEDEGFVYEEEITNLSEFEKEVLAYKKMNYRPKDIAAILSCDVKKVYNSICRIKKKINA